MELQRNDDVCNNKDSSKRKRKITVSDNQDSENQRPAKRQYSSSLESSSSPNSEESSITFSSSSATAPTSISQNSIHNNKKNNFSPDNQTSSSDCYSTNAEFDLAQLSSPPSSVLTCDENVENLVSVNQTTPHGIKRTAGWKQKSTCIVTPSSDLRICPLPSMSWADSEDVWKIMCRKDAKASLDRNPSMLQYHPGLQPRMRAILLDWLIEVCEVYKLHRETYYLAVDYLDRFLTKATMKINKTHLQLIGITCLFIAAKVEEIYPPKISEFAYVTDSACTEDDIIQQELILLKALDWNISPVTVMGWLSVYMQVNTTTNQKPMLKINNSNSINTSPVKFSNRNDDAFVYPQFSGMEFAHTAQLVDLCTLDVGLANFSYSVIAAAAMSHTMDRKRAILASGLEWEDIETCYKWMEPFFHVICEEGQPLFLLESNDQVKQSYGLHHICPNLVPDDSHILQTHTISLSMFEKVSLRKEQIIESEITFPEISPAIIDTKCPEGLLTPPASSRKPLDTNLIDVESENQHVQKI